MVFLFSFFPYTAMIGDIKGSRKSEKRKELQERFKAVLQEINVKYKEQIASKFMVTLGDEFQGLLNDGAYALEIMDEIERRMYPAKFRFGIGVGEITTDIQYEMPLSADGPAYYYAREMIEEVRASERKNRISQGTVRIKIHGKEDISALCNVILMLMSKLKKAWTPRRVEIINAYYENGQKQEKTAKSLSINQSGVQRALAQTEFYAYQGAMAAVSSLLAGVKQEEAYV
ncbi:MAG TPA: SatD family protein [Clostridia bacterium]|nr:SatD family protein [Clostridia bacterium]